MTVVKGIAFGVAAIFFTAAASPTETFLEERSGGSCIGQDFEPTQYLGGSTNAICESNWGTSYLPITKLTIWGGSQYVTGIQATYSDNTQSPVYGNIADKSAAIINFNYAQNNPITSLTLYGNPNGAYVRHIRIENKAGNVLNSGYANPVQAGYTTFPQNIGTGILYGFKGSTDGANINGLGFLFLASPLQSITLTDFHFTNPPQGDTDITPTDIDQYHAYNGQTSGNLTWAYNNQKTRTVTRTFQQTTTDTFAAGTSASASLMISAIIPGVGLNVGGGSSFTWTNMQQSQSTVSVATAKQIQYNSGGTLAPGKGVDVLFIAGEGTGNFAYTSTVTVTLQNGHKYAFQEGGSLYLDDVSDVIVDTYEDDEP